MNKIKILIIEDEPSISDNLEYALKTEGFDAVTVHTGGDGLTALTSANFALIILDIGLPDMNGFDVCKEIRRLSEVPIIFLTARDSEIDRVVGLEMGGDDYVTKPFSPRELTARVRAILRRTGDTRSSISPIPAKNADAKFALDTTKHEISYCGSALPLTHYEYEILKVMLESAGKVFSRQELMKQIWDSPEMSMERTVDTHIKQIRSKLQSVRDDANHIVTKRGFGYQLIL